MSEIQTTSSTSTTTATSFLVAVSPLRASGFCVKIVHRRGRVPRACRHGGRACCSGGPTSTCPAMSGLQLQTALAGTPNSIPILFLTGNADIASSVRAMRGGAEDFLEKRAPKEALRWRPSGAPSRATARPRGCAPGTANCSRASNPSTAREMGVHEQVLRGRLNKQIGGDLDISERTGEAPPREDHAAIGVRSVPAPSLAAQEAGATALSPFPKVQ